MENGASSSAPKVKEETKSQAPSERTTEAMAGFAGSVGAVGSATTGAVGRLVDSSQADDRRLIRLVRARRLLYARNNIPVASYYAQCKALWQEVADHCGRSVPEVRRKWSHIRNSYSRHLRNEVLGARTGRGRSVSRWYLADELAFLRDHMATDTRNASLSQYSAASQEFGESEGEGDGTAAAEGRSPLWANSGGGGGGVGVGAGAGDALLQLQPKVEAVYAASEDSTGSAGGDEEWGGVGCGSLAAFFRPLQGEWAGLRARRRRLFLRQSLALLHALLDEQDQQDTETAALVHPAAHEHEHAILPNQ